MRMLLCVCYYVWLQVDICPEHILRHSLQTLQTILKKPGVKKKPFLVSDPPNPSF